MSDVTNDIRSSSAEFDFALAGHVSTRLSESSVIKLVNVLRSVRNELVVLPPGELVSEFVSSAYAESKRSAQLPEMDDDVQQIEISALDTLDRNDILRDTSTVSLEVTTTAETTISTVDLGRPIPAPEVERQDVPIETPLTQLNDTDYGTPPFPSIAVDEQPVAEFEIEDVSDLLPEDRPYGEPVLLVPDSPIIKPDLQDDTESVTFFDQRSLLVPREGEPFVPSPAPNVSRVPSVVPQGASESAQKVRLPARSMPKRVVEPQTSSLKEMRGERGKTLFDSRLVLLLVGLVTLVTFVVLCVWLIINADAETGVGGLVGETNVAAYVPSETVVLAPTIIQAEDYDFNGAGTSFNDSDTLNSGQVYRSDGVDIAAVPNQDLKLAVVDTAAGEWLVYTFSVEEEGIFGVSTGVSSSIQQPGSIDTSVDGNRIGTFYGQSSSDEFNFVKHIVGEVELGPGEHEIRLDWSGNGGVSVDWIEISRA